MSAHMRLCMFFLLSEPIVRTKKEEEKEKRSCGNVLHVKMGFRK